MTIRVDLLSNASATGQAQGWPGGVGAFLVRGTFGGATVRLQFQYDDTWLDVAGGDVDLTAQGGGGFFLPEGLIRAEVEGGTPSGLFASAICA